MLLDARQKLLDLVAKARLPAIYTLKEFRRRGRFDLLWRRSERDGSARGGVRGQDSEKLISGRHSGRTADKVRTRH